MNARVPPVLYRHQRALLRRISRVDGVGVLAELLRAVVRAADVWFHAHGIVLALWLVMLVVQAQLIRTQRRSLHRQLGKLSYVVGAGRRRDHDGVRASARCAGPRRLAGAAGDGAALLGADAVVARRVCGVLRFCDRATPRLADARALDGVHGVPVVHARHGSAHRRALAAARRLAAAYRRQPGPAGGRVSRLPI